MLAGDSSTSLGSEQSLADLIQKLQLKRKKKEAAAAASAAIETVPNGNLGSVFAETLKPSNLNPNLPVAKMLELAKDGIVSLSVHLTKCLSTCPYIHSKNVFMQSDSSIYQIRFTRVF